MESGRELDFDRDVFDTEPRKKAKKRISVTLDFEIPPGFKFRKELSAQAALGSSFSIERAWQLDLALKVAESFEVIDSTGTSVANPQQVAAGFLALINYRYIPNRSVPADILRRESQAFATSIVRGMKTKVASELIQSLSDSATQLLKPSATSLVLSNSPITDPSIATGGDIVDMLAMRGFVAKGPHGRSVQDQDWGAGHQSFFLYSVLHEIDTDYKNYFGWRQATVWAIEEPESALHRDLEISLAGQLREWCHRTDAKFQVIQTTHSPVFCMASDVGYHARVDSQATSVDSHKIFELVRLAEDTGISHWTPPALSSPWSPVVLCEGPNDVAVLTHVANICGVRSVHFTCLTTLDDSEKGDGKDSILKYVRDNNKLLANRPIDCPMIVLVDWEVTDSEIEKLKKAYGPNSHKFVLRANKNQANPVLSSDFRGLERFYPESVVREAAVAGECLIADVPPNPISISESQFSKVKGRLAKRVLAIHDKSKLGHLEMLVRNIELALN